MNSENEEKAFQSLKKTIEETLTFPCSFRYKMIFEARLNFEETIKSWFTEDAKITYKASKTNKYTSMTIDAMMSNSDEIMRIYFKASKIEGLIIL